MRRASVFTAAVWLALQPSAGMSDVQAQAAEAQLAERIPAPVDPSELEVLIDEFFGNGIARFHRGACLQDKGKRNQNQSGKGNSKHAVLAITKPFYS